MRLRNKQWTEEYLQNNKDWMIDINSEQQIDLVNFFKNKNPLSLEIGCGKGGFIIKNAEQNNDNNFVGIEKERTVIGVALKKTIEHFKDKPIKNLKFLHIDIVKLSEIIKPKTINKIYLNFSDPWPKFKHAKYRITGSKFLEMYHMWLEDDGVIEIKTDNDKLYEFTLKEVDGAKFNIEYNTTNLYLDNKKLKQNIQTEYEKRFVDLGKNINKLILRKK